MNIRVGHTYKSMVFGLSFGALFLGCPPPSSNKDTAVCTRTGHTCKLKSGPLGVCMPLPNLPDIFECVPQH